MTTMTIEQRKQRAESMRGIKREVRRAPSEHFELRADDATGLLHFTGHASVTEKPYDMGWYEEEVARGAFTKTLSENPDVMFLLNHEGLPLARTTIPAGAPGHLSLAEDGIGLANVALLDPDDTDVQTLKRKTDAKLLDQQSFAFRATRQEWNEDYTKRRITEVDVNRGDVSVVNYGASPTTSFSLRSALRDRGVTFDGYRDALLELRAGATLSSATMSTLQQVLDLVAHADACIDQADDDVDLAQEVLSALMGVPNPDPPDPEDGQQQNSARGLLEATASMLALTVR